MTELLAQEFFAPADTDMVDAVIARYRDERAKIEHVCRFLHGDGLASVVRYFVDGNRDRRERLGEIENGGRSVWWWARARKGKAGQTVDLLEVENDG
jgi:hypothetical protein